MKIKSYAKINLTLNVNKRFKNKDRMHDIQSYFCLVDLFDLIQIKRNSNKSDKIDFIGKFANNVKKSKNTILQILRILRKRNIISGHYSIIVNKKIPVFAGMGGGTSNAYFLLKYLFKKKINKKLLNTLRRKIGSDFGLFFVKQGFLKNLHTVKKLPIRYKLRFLLVYPNLRLSTKIIYSKIREYTAKSRYDLKKINNKSKFLNFIKNKRNDLQSIVEKKHPNIKKLIEEINSFKGCHFSRMTGSGSVCYGVFSSDKTAKAALNQIKVRYPRYWLSIAKTI